MEEDYGFDMFEFIEHKNSGMIVETKSGKLGRTYNSRDLIDGKLQVICEDGTKLLCRPETLKLKGFID